MDWQFDGFLESRHEERLTHAATRAAAAGIPPERDRDVLTMTMSPSATAQFRDPAGTFNNHKGVPWPGAAVPTIPAPNAQDDMLVDLYYKSPSVWMTVLAGAIGFVVGAVLNKYSISEDAQLWIGVFGFILIRALECLTLPLIFTSVTICFSNLVVSDKTRPVLMRLAIYFVLAALVASCVAVAVAFCLSGSFEIKPDPVPATTNFQFILRCPSGKYFSREDECAAVSVFDGQVLTAANVTGLPDSLQLSLATASGVYPDTQSLVTQIVLFFGDFFTENITSAFVSVQFLGVTIFSMVIGAAIMAVYDPTGGELNHALLLVRQIHVVLEMILNWLVPYIPLGTLSMMTYSIMTGEVSQEAMRRSLYFTLTMVVALLANFFFVACVLYVVLVRRNPLKFTWFLMPGVIFMLATGNYLATIPVLIRSLEKSRQVSRTLAQFTICLGVCLCLCGTAIFFVVAPIFMAYTSGLGDIVTPGRVIGLVAIATASSIGTPLVPGSALTFTCTIWRTLFASQVPGSFAYVVAMEWVMYRLRRTYNIIVAAFIARIIAEQLDETVEDEDDRVYLDQQLGMTRGPPI
ncbi:Dicarboxylate/amino acid:cation (Na or H) symporter protein [Phytophthora megakarya]|uniref:Amino acid transporter n=1 Tax=Phytophthora megakarya TaxID=4795 RepID=A0A225WS87_9STRA|nr:Dicarboxylate/amino acid:cation (Na or H) symporter protein [Phytophthora megakarya]